MDLLTAFAKAGPTCAPSRLAPILTPWTESSSVLDGFELGLMKRWRLVLLGFELALFALILVLPQVTYPTFPSAAGRLRWQCIREYAICADRANEK